MVEASPQPDTLPSIVVSPPVQDLGAPCVEAIKLSDRLCIMPLCMMLPLTPGPCAAGKANNGDVLVLCIRGNVMPPQHADTIHPDFCAGHTVMPPGPDGF